MGLADLFGVKTIQRVGRAKALRMARKAPLFRSMSSAALSDLIDESTQTIYDAATTIVRQGERDDTVYMILSGRVRVLYSDSQTEIVVAELGLGEVFGEMAALETQPRSATVITVTQTNCLRVPGAVFLAALSESRES